MKRKNYILYAVLLITAFALWSCQRAVNTQEPAALGAYKSVLENKAVFFSADDNKDFNLNDFLNDKLPENSLTITHFTTLDMDGDKLPEVVLELSVGSDPAYFEVLKYMNDKVVGYNFTYRALMQLKTDGSFNFSNGAADTGYGKLKFSATGSEIEKLGYSESSYSNDVQTISYFIDNKPVTEEEFNTYIKEQNEKEDVVWHEFSQQNIEGELTSNN